MKKICIILIISSVLIDINAHTQNWLLINDTISKACYSFNILESNEFAYKVRFKIHRIGYESVEKNGIRLQKLYFDSFNSLQNLGEPALPTILQHIAIPYGSELVAELIENEWKQLDVEKIYPAQIPSVDGNDSTFTICDSIYLCERFFHPLISSSEIMKWKGVNNLFITICPFRYFPSSYKLSVLTDFTLSVKFNNTGKGNNDYPKYKEKDISIFNNSIYMPVSRVDTCLRKTSNTGSYDYLIIVGNIPEIENSESMTKFRKWKALKGYKTKLVSTATIGTDTTSIKNYIIAQQNENGIRQVLFIGNNEKIPVAIMPPWNFQTENELRKSDYWYGCLDGINDLEAEIPIGRFLTNTLEDFSNIVDKTIKYESQYHNWNNRNLLVAHEQTNYFQTVLDTISSLAYSHPLSFYKAYGAPTSIGGLGSDKYDVIDYINYGMNIVTVNCHGNAGGFWLYSGNNSTVNYEDRILLSNDTYPIIFSNACYNGDFTNYIHSIAAYFSCSDHCSTAYMGTTMPSYIIAGNKYLLNLYRNLLDNGLYNLGDLISTSHIMNLGFGPTAKDNAFNYICAGDPSLEIWTALPQMFENVDISISNDNLLISTTNADMFKVNIVSEEGLLLDKYLSENSVLSIPKPSENCYISIDKHDYIPYVIYINEDNHYIQNVTIDENSFYVNTPIFIGYNVTSSQGYGNVTVEPGSKVIINKGLGVTIKNGFECKQGSEFIIK